MKQRAARTRTAEVVRGLAALTVLILLLAGLPAALVAVGGSPLPHSLPTWAQITTTTDPARHEQHPVPRHGQGDRLGRLGPVHPRHPRRGHRLSARTTGPTMPGPIRPMQHLARDWSPWPPS